MNEILLIGAGRSTPSLIDYLVKKIVPQGVRLSVCDANPDLVNAIGQLYPNIICRKVDIFNEEQRKSLIEQADIVISMLPAHLHSILFTDCLQHRTHLVTASYVSGEASSQDKAIREAGLVFMMECGLDPGLDHMTAMYTMDRLTAAGNQLTAFETFTGGLLAPSTRDNPWEYKFTWNPRNVVLAGQGGVKFIQEGRYKYIPYHRLFHRTEVVHIPGYGYFEGYANRDSLKYLNLYQLEGIRTLFRGTFRKVGFCKAWDIFVQLGATDDSYEMEGVEGMTHRQFINSFLSYNPHDSVELKLAHYLQLDLEGPEMYKLKWLGLFEEELVGLKRGTPAQILEHILKKKWTMEPDERDQVIMWHKFDYLINEKPAQIQSYLVATGDDNSHTAMAKTVGLPLGIVCRLLLEGKISQTGVVIPTKAEIYEPVLSELNTLGIEFKTREMNVLHETPG